MKMMNLYLLIKEKRIPLIFWNKRLPLINAPLIFWILNKRPGRLFDDLRYYSFQNSSSTIVVFFSTASSGKKLQLIKVDL